MLASKPFEAYNVYKVLHKKEGRCYAQLVPRKDIDTTGLKRKTISYARYLMSTHLGRLLTDEEHVDHINDIKLDDRIENLQILSQKENNIKAGLVRRGEIKHGTLTGYRYCKCCLCKKAMSEYNKEYNDKLKLRI